MNTGALASWSSAELGRLGPQTRALLLPFGATEQHGPHLPVTTDSEIAEAITSAVAARRPDQVLVAPVMPFGSSGEHQGLPGTLSIGQEVTERLVIELVRSAWHDFHHIVLVSTHGGNSAPLRRAVQALAYEGRPVDLWWPRWPGDLHAGHTETSVMAAIAPDRTHLERAHVGNTLEISALASDLAALGVAAVSPNGVLGDPTTATADHGRALLESAIADLVALVDRVTAHPRPAKEPVS